MLADPVGELVAQAVVLLELLLGFRQPGGGGVPVAGGDKVFDLEGFDVQHDAASFP